MAGNVLTCHFTFAQTSNASTMPYYEIPEAPDEYTPNTVAARMIDGLGFRYFWATEGLRTEDLAYRPNETARSSEETLDHIYGLSLIIIKAHNPDYKPDSRKADEMSFEEKRKYTLNHFKQASDVLKSANTKSLEDYPIVSGSGDQSSSFPYWNMINGPIADAIWHVGQIVSFRRSSGNPFNSKASVFSGKVRK